jgi:predicted ester cyclase
MAQPLNFVVRERNVQLVQRFITLVLERGLADVCEELMHPELQFIDPSWPPSAPNGSAGVREAVRAIHEHFSGYTLRMDDIFAVGEDIVVNRFTGHAIHKGGFFGSNAVNRPVTWTGNTIYRFKDGLIHRIWLQWDLLGTLVQLEILPAPTPNTPPPWAVPPVPGTPYVASDRRNPGRTGDQASVETNLATVRRMFAGITSEPIAALAAACLAPNYGRDDNCALAGAPNNLAGFERYVRAARENFEGYKMEIDEIFGEGDRVVARVHASGLHRGGFLGVVRGGQQVDFTLTFIYRMEQGKIAHSWVTWDVFRALNQMGAIPAAPATLDGP